MDVETDRTKFAGNLRQSVRSQSVPKEEQRLLDGFVKIINKMLLFRRCKVFIHDPRTASILTRG